MSVNLFKNKKGQILGYILSLIIFIIVWSLFLAKWINDTVAYYIVQNNLTGIEAFLLANLNLWIMIFIFIVLVLLTVFGR